MIRRKRRGQILIIVGVVLSLLILSVAITIYAGSLQYGQYSQSTYNSAALNIADDFSRVLTNILAGATVSFNSTTDLTTPRAWALTNFTDWIMAMQNTYSTAGIQSQFFTTNSIIGPGETTNYSLIKLYWYGPTAVSAISAGYRLNLTSQGLYGVASNDTILLQSTIGGVSESSTSCGKKGYPATTQLSMTVLRENNLPVDDLGNYSFKVDYFNNTRNAWTTAKITGVLNTGGGNYVLSVVGSNGCAIPSPFYKYLIVWVMDDRGIMTESYSYTSIQYVIQENAIHNFYPTSNQSSEIYTLETISNGTVLWFGKPLKFSNGAVAVPIPIPPVKQLRVYTNSTGKFVLTPSQTEVWTANYSYPTLNFANWRTRFELGDKLVYFVNFANTQGKKVAVNITWLTDADAAPPQYRLNIQTSSGFVDINNSVYTLRLLNNVRLSLSIDYSISLIANGYHIESELSAVGWIKSAGWEPYMLPGGDWNDSTSTSFIIEGPVRAVAFRSSSNDTLFNYNSNTNQFTEVYNSTGPLMHTDIILVPYNVPYVELFETYKWIAWNSPSGIGSMLNLITLISGVSDSNMMPQDPTLRPTMWAYQNSSSGVVAGPYENPFLYPHGGFNTSTQQMGLWFTQFNNSIGEAVIGGDGFNSTIKQINPSQAEFYIWNSYDGDRNVFWPAQLTPWSSSSITISPVTESYSAALWVYKGFVGQNYANLPPNIYYRMFLSNYFPTIVSSSITT